jgi:hypothetical protein
MLSFGVPAAWTLAGSFAFWASVWKVSERDPALVPANWTQRQRIISAVKGVVISLVLLKRFNLRSNGIETHLLCSAFVSNQSFYYFCCKKRALVFVSGPVLSQCRL